MAAARNNTVALNNIVNRTYHSEFALRIDNSKGLSMKKKERKLTLHRETVRHLKGEKLGQIAGGFGTDTCVIGSCVDCNAHETTMVW